MGKQLWSFGRMSMQWCQGEFCPLMASSRRKIANMVCFGERSSTFLAISSAQIGDYLAISRVMRWLLGINTMRSFFWMGRNDTTPLQPVKFTTARESNFAPPCISQLCSKAIPFYSCCDRGEKVDASIFNPRTLALIIKPNNQTPFLPFTFHQYTVPSFAVMQFAINIKLTSIRENRMSGQASQPKTPNVQRLLYEKYSSSQTYFYTNKINQIVRERRSAVNIFYEDVEYLLDLEENLKRWYQMREFDNKMFTFKEYYFYHQDCPRIFLKGIEEAYAKWQDKKRDLVYKRLKIAYNESDSSDSDSRVDEQKSQNYVALSHFLLEISEYNPYSKKYYLRAEARKDKEKKRYEEEKRNQSKRDLQSLKNDLSAMLNDISQLSEISTLQSVTPKNAQKYKSIKLGTISIKKSKQRSGNSSSNLSNSNSLIKFNFKKHKESNEKFKETRKISLKKEALPKQESKDERRLSPKYNSNVAPNELIKSRSIFSVSSFGALRNTDIKPNHKRDTLKLNFQSKKLVIDDSHKKYETQKKKEPSRSKILTIQTKSTSKFEPRHSLQKLRSKDSSTGKHKQDEFSDKKMNDANSQYRMRSLKSEFISSSKKALLSIKPTLQLQKGKRLLQIKNW